MKLYSEGAFNLKENNRWKLSDVKNIAVFTTKQVVNKEMPIVYVSHDEDDGAWQFHHGEIVNIEDAMVVSLELIVSLDNTLNELFDLPLGWIAIRKSFNDSWIKKQKNLDFSS